MYKKLFLFSILCIVGVASYLILKNNNLFTHYEIGDPVDSLNHVIVYYNGGTGNNSGRNVSADNYNIGLKYQCVEFVKRYYYQHLHHKMPDPYGNAKDFFDNDVADGKMNKKRNLIQYRNGSKSRPKEDDLLILSATLANKYGHVAIISSVSEDEIEIIQQNPGAHGKSRKTIDLDYSDGKWTIDNDRVLGWLRKE